VNQTEWQQWNETNANQTEWLVWNETIANQTEWKVWNETIANLTEWHEWNMSIANRTEWHAWNESNANLTQWQTWNETKVNQTEWNTWNTTKANQTEWQQWNETLWNQSEMEVWSLRQSLLRTNILVYTVNDQFMEDDSIQFLVRITNKGNRPIEDVGHSYVIWLVLPNGTKVRCQLDDTPYTERGNLTLSPNKSYDGWESLQWTITPDYDPWTPVRECEYGECYDRRYAPAGRYTFYAELNKTVGNEPVTVYSNNASVRVYSYEELEKNNELIHPYYGNITYTTLVYPDTCSFCNHIMIDAVLSEEWVNGTLVIDSCAAINCANVITNVSVNINNDTIRLIYEEAGCECANCICDARFTVTIYGLEVADYAIVLGHS